MESNKRKAKNDGQKRRNEALNIAGTKPNIQNAQLLISSGIPALDNILGGGVAVGSLILIEDDVFATYGPIVQKYFLAEGVVNEHSLFVASKEINPQEIINDLPAVVAEQELSDEINKSRNDSEKMTIAWRYQHLPKVQDEKQNLSFGHHYDLSKKMSTDEIKKIKVHCWSNDSKNINIDAKTFANPIYNQLLKNIKNFIQINKLEVEATPTKRTILRIVIHGIGTPYWIPGTMDFVLPSDADKDVSVFLFCLKAILRSSFAVAMITIPTGVIEKSYMERCIHISDTAITLETFVGTPNEKNPALANYDGFLKILKLPTFNTIEAPQLTDFDLAFKLYRKKFSIEKLHLPPEMEDSKQREQDETPQLSCSSFSKLKLDF